MARSRKKDTTSDSDDDAAEAAVDKTPESESVEAASDQDTPESGTAEMSEDGTHTDDRVEASGDDADTLESGEVLDPDAGANGEDSLDAEYRSSAEDERAEAAGGLDTPDAQADPDDDAATAVGESPWKTSPEAQEAEAQRRDMLEADPEELLDERSEEAVVEDAAPKVAPAPPPRQRSIVIPMVLGGAVAALIGFGAARFAEFQGDGPQTGPTLEDLAATLDDQAGRIDALSAELDSAPEIDVAGAVSEAVSPVTAALEAATGQFDTLAGRLAELETQVETLALRPTAPTLDPGEFDEALSAFRADLAAAISDAQAEIDQARAAAQAITDEAFRAERAAIARAAWSQVETALASGVPFDAPLAEAEEYAGVAVPEALKASAGEGVPTLDALKDTFPDAARSALTASIRATTDGGTMDRIGAFLKLHSGVRSLTPREGDDPDAVLSRAEAAVRVGDLGAALDEISALPEPGLAALAGWADRARLRLEVTAAAQDVSQQITTN